MKIRFIGDIHGNFKKYKEYLDGDFDMSIQVGDFGIGFGNLNILNGIDTNKNRFIRGNHDNPTMIKSMAGYINDGDMVNGILCVGGAKSIDAHHRTQGVDWWADEEVSYAVAVSIISDYENLKTSIIVSHDCPRVAMPFPEYSEKSMTSNLLDSLLKIRAPAIWVYGHHHYDFEKVVNGCQMVCVI